MNKENEMLRAQRIHHLNRRTRHSLRHCSFVPHSSKTYFTLENLQLDNYYPFLSNPSLLFKLTIELYIY